MGYQSYPVRSYVPDVIRFYKCQGMDHTVNSCKGSKRCVRCRGPHGFEQCTTKEERKCARCGGPYSAPFEGCQEIKKHKRIQFVLVNNTLSYVDAVALCEESTRNNNTDLHEVQQQQKQVETYNLGQNCCKKN